jgi:hypothetical protein
MELNHYAMQVERDYKISEAHRNAEMRRLIDEAVKTNPTRSLWLKTLIRKLALWIKDHRPQFTLQHSEHLKIKLREGPSRLGVGYIAISPAPSGTTKTLR